MSNNRNPNLARIFPRDTYAPGTYRKTFQVGGSSDASLRWSIQAGGSGVASITIYSTLYTEERDLQPLDPSVNFNWSDETPQGAVFDFLPAGAPGSGKVSFGPNPGIQVLMVELVVSVQLVNFELVGRRQGRAG